MTSWDYMVVPDYLRMEPRSEDTMFDDRQTKEEIIAAASVQNQRLVEALCECNRKDAEIERLTAALREIAEDDPCPARNIARRTLGEPSTRPVP